MQVWKSDEIVFTETVSYGETLMVSQPLVMASAAGWYVGKVCKGEFCVEPYDRFTDYFATPEEAQVVLDTPIEDGGFNENFGVVEKEFG